MMDKDFPRTKVEPVAAENTVLEAKVDALAEEVAALKERPSSVEFTVAEKPSVVPVADLQPFKIGKKKYQFTLPRFYWNGSLHIASESLGKPELLAAFVEANIGVVEEVTE